MITLTDALCMLRDLEQTLCSRDITKLNFCEKQILLNELEKTVENAKTELLKE